LGPGLRPDALEKLKRCPNPLAVAGEEIKKRKGREGEGEKRGMRRGRKGGEGKGKLGPEDLN